MRFGFGVERFLGVFGLGVGEEFVAEFGDDGLYRPRTGFAEGADGAAVDLVGYAFQSADVFGAGLAVDEAVGDFFHPHAAFAARGALTTGFVGVEGVEVVENPGDFAAVVDDDDTSGTCHGAAGGEAIEVHRDVPEIQITRAAIGVLELEGFIAAEDFRGGSAGDHGLEFAAVFGTSADVVEQLAHCELADFHFEVAGLFDITGDAENPGASIAGDTEFGVFVAAHLHDVFDVAE